MRSNIWKQQGKKDKSDFQRCDWEYQSWKTITRPPNSRPGAFVARRKCYQSPMSWDIHYPNNYIIIYIYPLKTGTAPSSMVFLCIFHDPKNMTSFVAGQQLTYIRATWSDFPPNKGFCSRFTPLNKAQNSQLSRDLALLSQNWCVPTQLGTSGLLLGSTMGMQAMATSGNCTGNFSDLVVLKVIIKEYQGFKSCK